MAVVSKMADEADSGNVRAVENIDSRAAYRPGPRKAKRQLESTEWAVRLLVGIVERASGGVPALNRLLGMGLFLSVGILPAIVHADEVAWDLPPSRVIEVERTVRRRIDWSRIGGALPLGAGDAPGCWLPAYPAGDSRRYAWATWMAPRCPVGGTRNPVGLAAKRGRMKDEGKQYADSFIIRNSFLW